MKKALRSIIDQLAEHPEQFVTIRVRPSGMIDMTLWRTREGGIIPEEEPGVFSFQGMEDDAWRDALESFALKLRQHNRRGADRPTPPGGPLPEDDIPF